MLSVIEEVAETWEKDLTPPIANALGYAVEAYTSWHVRGDDRKAFLQRACDYYRRAGNNAALAKLLVEKAPVRNLEEAIPLLETIYKKSTKYDPVLCSYLDALYKDGQYIRAYEAGVHIHRLAEETKKYWDAQMEQVEADDSPAYRKVVQHFMSSVPTGPMQFAASSLRAEAKRLKKDGQLEQTIEILKLLKGTGHATANDMKRLERLIG